MSIPSTAPLRDWLGSGDLALGVTTPWERLPGPLADQRQRWCKNPLHCFMRAQASGIG